MSQRMGMADGRCITSYDSNRIINDSIMASHGIAITDNYSYRMLLQSKGPSALGLPLANPACGGG